MRLDPLSLKLFVGVVERGSIAAAAQAHPIAPAAVSKRISELEATLRTPLLRRTNKGVEATPAGHALVNHARRLLSDLDEIVLEMRDWSGGTRGSVRVHANISAITQFLPQEMAAFLAAYPQVQVHLQERISTAVVKAVVENEADVGICVMGLVPNELEVFAYHHDELVLITPRGHALGQRKRVRFEEALGFDVVGLHTGSAINQLLTRAAMALGRTLNMRIQVTSYDALVRMVEAGLGIGVMPRAVAQPLGRSLGIHVAALAEPWAARELSICVRAYAALPVAARLLVDSLRRPV